MSLENDFKLPFVLGERDLDIMDQRGIVAVPSLIYRGDVFHRKTQEKVAKIILDALNGVVENKEGVEVETKKRRGRPPKVSG